MRLLYAIRHSRYLPFFVNGALINLGCLLLRQFIGSVVPDTDLWYAAVVAAIYCCAFVVNYAVQGTLIFQPAATHPNSWGRAAKFVTINVLAVALTILGATILRHQPAFVAGFKQFADSAAMACSALLVSFLSYYFTSKLVFGRRAKSTLFTDPRAD